MTRPRNGNERRGGAGNMKIAVIGCGAMGALFGGYLSQNHEVTLVDRKPERMAKIQ